MSQKETAEAIIVVGPYVWKCVNCNLLMSHQHSIDDHLVSHHTCLLKPETSTNVQCKLSVCDCQKMAKALASGRKENRRTKHTRKRKRNPALSGNSDSKFIKPSKGCDSTTCGKGEKDGSDCDENNEDFVESSLSVSFQNSKERDSIALSSEENEAKDSACSTEEIEIRQTLNENSENEPCNAKSNTDDTHPETTISVNTGKTERGNKFEFEEEEEQSSCTRKSSRSNKGKNSLYSEFEMRIS